MCYSSMVFVPMAIHATVPNNLNIEEQEENKQKDPCPRGAYILA